MQNQKGRMRPVCRPQEQVIPRREQNRQRQQDEGEDSSPLEDVCDCLVRVDGRVPGVWRLVLEVYRAEGENQGEEAQNVEGLAACGDGAEEVGEGLDLVGLVGGWVD